MSIQQRVLGYENAGVNIEKYDEQTGELWMRAFGIADGLITSNNWIARNVVQFGKSLIKKWVVDQDLNPKIHRKFTNLKEWLLQSEKAAIGTIEDIDVNEKTGALDIIYKVTDSLYKQKVLGGKLDKRYSSPAIWGYKLRRDPESGLLVYDEWEGVHVALVKIPAFPKSIAQINDNICIGGIKCANELAAVASPDLENFTSDIKEMGYKSNDYNKMSAEDTKRTVPYEEYIGLKNNSETKLKDLESKYNESIAVNKKISETKETVETKYKELESKWTEREKEDRKKSFSEKLAKIFEGEELDNKVKFAVEKNYSDDDIDQLYGPLLKKAEEENQEQTQQDSKKNAQLDKAGVASSSKMDNKISENVELALSIANQRRRLF